MLQKGDPVRDPHHIHGAAQAIVEVRHAGQRHVAAIAAAGHHHAPGIQIGARWNPVQKRADVLHRILALAAVVQIQERLPIAGRPAHIRENDGRS